MITKLACNLVKSFHSASLLFSYLSIELHLDIIRAARRFFLLTKAERDALFLRIAGTGRLNVLSIARVFNHSVLFIPAIVVSLIGPVNTAVDICLGLLLVRARFCVILLGELLKAKDSLTLTGHHKQVILVVEIEQLRILLVTIQQKTN